MTLEREGPGLEAAVRAHLARVEEQLAAQSARAMSPGLADYVGKAMRR